MKRFLLLLFLSVVFAFPVCAETQDDAIIACLKSVYPQAEFHQITQWGDTAATALESGGTKFLCILERQNGQWQLVVNSGSILLQEEVLPSVLLDTDEILFWSYNIWPHTVFHAARAQDGVWRFIDEIISQNTGDGSVLETMLFWQNRNGGELTYRSAYYDENDNRISANYEKRIPAMWMADRIALNHFDIARFPILEVEEYDGQWPNQTFIREAAGYLMPAYTYVDGSLADGHLQFLMDKPDGTRVFVGCVCDQELHLTESAPLPADTSYGFENYTNSLYVDGLIVTPRYFPNHHQWGVRYLMVHGDEIQFGINCIKSSYDADTLYFGFHPWNDIVTIDWTSLPHSLEEATDALSAEGWALVHNPNPADRLHLRENPDQKSKSLGKYYSRTPVRILETTKDWVHVEVFGQIGWMMKKYLDFSQPDTIILSVFPQPEIKQQAASLYASAYAGTATKTITNTYGMYIVGIIGDEWFHVWFPLTGESGFVQQYELL